jgi:hypothetical protein
MKYSDYRKNHLVDARAEHRPILAETRRAAGAQQHHQE